MTPFAKENRVTSIFGYREFYLNGKLVKGQHYGIDAVGHGRNLIAFAFQEKHMRLQDVYLIVGP